MKAKPVVLFLLFTSIIIGVTAGFAWWHNRQLLGKVSYLPSPEWSKPRPVVGNIDTGQYRVCLIDEQLAFFWIEKDYHTLKEKLYMQLTGPHGVALAEPELLVVDQSLRDFAVEATADSYHLFWLAGEEEGHLSLKYRELDRRGKTVTETILQTGLYYTTQLQSDIVGNIVYLTWSTTRKGYDQIDLAAYNILSGDYAQSQVTNSSSFHSIYPNLLVRERVKLVWLQQNPEKLCGTSRGSNRNEYLIKARQFDRELHPLSRERTLADAAYYQGMVAPDLVAGEGDTIHLIWSCYQQGSESNSGDNLLVIKHLAFDSVTGRCKQKPRLLSGSFNSRAPDMVQLEDAFRLAYVRTAETRLELRLTRIDDWNERAVSSMRPFPGQTLASKPRIFKDPQNYLYLTWLEEGQEDTRLFYATNRYPHQPGFLELLGVDSGEGVSQFLTIILYFLVYPVFKLGNVVFVLGAVAVMLFLSWLGDKVTSLYWLNRASNPYLTYTLVMVLTTFSYISKGNLAFLFYPASPPDVALPLLLIIVTIASLAFLRLVKLDSEFPILAGGAAGLLWFYWIAQANLVFYLFQYN
ncbi:MAG: hypothetical protein UMV23_04380 [Halanaerobium sp.]|nr:hypothetical protein [Halanaerobium sp.]